MPALQGIPFFCERTPAASGAPPLAQVSQPDAKPSLRFAHPVLADERLIGDLSANLEGTDPPGTKRFIVPLICCAGPCGEAEPLGRETRQNTSPAPMAPRVRVDPSRPCIQPCIPCSGPCRRCHTRGCMHPAPPFGFQETPPGNQACSDPDRVHARRCRSGHSAKSHGRLLRLPHRPVAQPPGLPGQQPSTIVPPVSSKSSGSPSCGHNDDDHPT